MLWGGKSKLVMLLLMTSAPGKLPAIAACSPEACSPAFLADVVLLLASTTLKLGRCCHGGQSMPMTVWSASTTCMKMPPAGLTGGSCLFMSTSSSTSSRKPSSLLPRLPRHASQAKPHCDLGCSEEFACRQLPVSRQRIYSVQAPEQELTI